MLVRPRRIAEAYWACGGAILLILTRLIALPQTMRAVSEGWDVYLFSAGTDGSCGGRAGGKECLSGFADVAAQHRYRNPPARVFALILSGGALAVTALLFRMMLTAVALTPAVPAVVRRAKVDPKALSADVRVALRMQPVLFSLFRIRRIWWFSDQHMPPLLSWLRIFLTSLRSLPVVGERFRASIPRFRGNN